MRLVIVLATLITLGIAAPSGDDSSATILSNNRDNNGLDKYNFDFETSSGIKRQEHGVLKHVEENTAIVVDGVVSWTSPEGTLVVLKFTADENGYHPVV